MLAKRWEDYEDEEEYFAPQPERQPAVAVPPKRHLTLVKKKRTLLNTHLRSRCSMVLILLAVLSMAVVIRSGISASRGYTLVALQQEAQQLELENERLRIEIAKLKSPQRIKTIAATELGMEVPNKMYFAHEK
ncbi:MAG: cell division protein FtsL [Selenomonadaceae bacterium]|nr:cell division protein FtsL [Selenomonadaceae bacterium]